jgi:uncharacterized protein with NAD-binding domain and iron-sulfur cluster
MSKSVIVLGGGMAGLTAAHELVERGFRVRVFERRDVPGGKARSVVVPSTRPVQNVGTVHLGKMGTIARRDLPGEHGFRFFPRFYRHVIDTMKRTPYKGSRSVADNLVDTNGTLFARFGKPPLTLPNTVPTSILDLLTLLNDLDRFWGPELGIAPEDHAFFVERLLQILTSCEERRAEEYEKIDWWQFVDAERRSEIYQKVYAIGITRSLVAAKARSASTKTIGNTYVQMLFNLSDSTTSSIDRVLDGPTNYVWINPWLEYLRSRGVEYHLNSTVRSIDVAGGRVRGVTVERNRRTETVEGDYYVAALPIEVMAELVTDELVQCDPSLAHVFSLNRYTGWMNGIQFYLSEDVPIGPGHQIYLDSPWALTSISQTQFWRDVDLSSFADGRIRGVISVAISDWDSAGLNGKPARECSRYEIRDEVWEELKRSINVQGTALLEDEDLRYWFLDQDIDPLLRSNAEPLLINEVDTWRLRPSAQTRIPNFVLAADYVQTYTDLATMEGANEAARRAVNAILADSGASESPCAVWKLHEPQILEPWRAHDRLRYQQQLPWDGTLPRLGLAALAALYRGTAALDSTIRQVVASSANVDDVLAHLRTGERRAESLRQIVQGEGDSTGELLRAFAAVARAGGGQQVENVSASAIDALSVVGRALTQADTPPLADEGGGGNIRFVAP